MAAAMGAGSRLKARLSLPKVRIPDLRKLLRGLHKSAGSKPDEVDLDAPDLDEDGKPAKPRSRQARLAILAGTGAALAASAAVLWLAFGAADRADEPAPLVAEVVVPVDDKRPPPPKPPLAEINLPDATVALAPAPAEGLTEAGAAGPLPRVAEDGRTPWRAYARAFVHDDPRPRLALVVAGIGGSSTSLGQAVRQLPGAVTLALPAGAPQLSDWVGQARADGHEVLLDLPMEPLAYPADDPGPNTLLVALGAEQNLERLRWALSRAAGYVGVTSLSGSRFTGQPEALKPVLAEVQRRGLLLLDGRASPRSAAGAQATALGMPRAVGDAVVDADPNPAAIDAELKALEEIALGGQTAVGFVGAYPVTLQRLAAWIPTLKEKGIVLAPVSAVVNRQPDR